MSKFDKFIDYLVFVGGALLMYGLWWLMFQGLKSY